MRRLTAACGLLCALVSMADARPRQARIVNTESVHCVMDNNGRQTCENYSTAVRTRGIENGTQVVGRRPPGCPKRYCGCEASLYLFGVIKPQLNLAWNWVRLFPRTSPAPKMAAARKGHVMVLISHVGGSDWLVHDGNSGGGLTRRHVRSIKGYVVVDPNGSRVALR